MSRLRRVVMVVGPIALSACGHSPEPTFLTLDYAPPLSVGRPATTPFRIGAVHVPPTLDRPELARETQAGKVQIDDFARWSAPIDQIVRRTLTEDLIARLPSGSVIYPVTTRDIGTAAVTVDMLSLVERDHALHLVVGWSLVRPMATGHRTQTAMADRRSLTLAAPLNDETAPAFAHAMTALCGMLADDIASSLAARN